ncbi:hypothetical protein HC031_09800 [Planosporangium thailandense]|uniref:Uncharacterized protein n=1 Tax=Planosporangium thailandense TaxID=765197 RepID=A0ABX0XVZ1_9ACTN|nr:hypothetical protein [Planosporangium thailandense]NJC70001.1 hypothetical protein [Planosporangium thailandense]
MNERQTPDRVGVERIRADRALPATPRGCLSGRCAARRVSPVPLYHRPKHVMSAHPGVARTCPTDMLVAISIVGGLDRYGPDQVAVEHAEGEVPRVR